MQIVVFTATQSRLEFRTKYYILIQYYIIRIQIDVYSIVYDFNLSDVLRKSC